MSRLLPYALRLSLCSERSPLLPNCGILCCQPTVLSTELTLCHRLCPFPVFSPLPLDDVQLQKELAEVEAEALTVASDADAAIAEYRCVRVCV